MKIECMCIVCHGPIPMRNGKTSRVCHENCRQLWKRMVKGGDLPDEYQQRRWAHAYRREMEATYQRLAAFAAILERVESEHDGRTTQVPTGRIFYMRPTLQRRQG